MPGDLHANNYRGQESGACFARESAPFKLGYPLALAATRGFKSVNLEAVTASFPDCAFEDWELAFAAFPNAFLDPAECSLSTCSVLEFPTAERGSDVLVFIAWPETHKLVSQQKVDDFFKRQAGQLYTPGEPGRIFIGECDGGF